MYFIKRLKKGFAVLTALTMSFSLAGCGDEEMDGGSGSSSDISGSIMIYTSMYNDIIDNMKVALKKQFPNLKVEFFQGGTGTL